MKVPFVRFDKTIARKFPPTPDSTDLQWDPDTESLVTVDHTGAKQPIGGSGSLTPESLVTAAEGMTSGQEAAFRGAVGLGADDSPEFESLTVDGVELADSTGFTVPPNTLGRKGGELYFGNTPVAEGETKFNLASITSNGAGGKASLLSFDIPASQMVAGYWAIEMRIGANFTSVAPQSWGVLMDFIDNPLLETGFLFSMGDAIRQIIDFRGVLQFELEGGLLRPSVALVGGNYPIIFSETSASPAPTDSLKGMFANTEYMIPLEPSGVPNVAGVLRFIMHDISAASGVQSNMSATARLRYLGTSL